MENVFKVTTKTILESQFEAKMLKLFFSQTMKISEEKTSKSWWMKQKKTTNVMTFPKSHVKFWDARIF